MPLGLDNNYTRGARRLIAFAVAKSSYETAAFQLQEFGCLSISHQTVSNLVPSLSDEVQSKLANNAGVRRAFQEAKGDTEFTTDGVFVNIRMKTRHIAGWSAKLRVLRSGSGLLKSDIFDADQQDEVRSLLTYLCNNRERLFTGLAIGSGVVEGACKNLVGRRLKQTGTCWRQGRQRK